MRDLGTGVQTIDGGAVLTTPSRTSAVVGEHLSGQPREVVVTALVDRLTRDPGRNQEDCAQCGIACSAQQ
jgi:hypothetical protein